MEEIQSRSVTVGFLAMMWTLCFLRPAPWQKKRPWAHAAVTSVLSFMVAIITRGLPWWTTVAAQAVMRSVVGCSSYIRQLGWTTVASSAVDRSVVGWSSIRQPGWTTVATLAVWRSVVGCSRHKATGLDNYCSHASRDEISSCCDEIRGCYSVLIVDLIKFVYAVRC